MSNQILTTGLFPPELRRCLKAEDPARVASASEGLGTAMTSLETRKLDEDELLAWIGVVNDLRLVLGTRIEIRSLRSGRETLVVVAYGLLLPEWVLDWPARGCVNIHASLVPPRRGGAPASRV